MNSTHIVIIGSGLGGLASGVLLASEGFRVTILEKNKAPGGCLRSDTQNGFRFNFGAEIITAPFLFDQLFEKAGRNRKDYFEFQPFDPVFQAIFPGGRRFAFFNDPAMTSQMNGLFSPADQASFLTYCEENDKVFNEIFFDTYASPLSAAPLFPWGKRFPGWNNAELANRFEGEEIRRLFNCWPLLAGGNPKESSNLDRVIPAIFNRWGAWIPVGGMKTLVDALVSLFLESGGEIFYETEVQELQIFNRRVSGVRLSDGSIQHADIVLSNADVLTTSLNLIDSDQTRYADTERAKKLEPGTSVFVYHLGLNCILEEKLSLAGNNFIFPEKYEGFLTELFEYKQLSADPFFLLRVPSKNDPYASPPGCQSLSVVAPVPNLSGKIEWAQASFRFRNRILDLIQPYFLTDLRTHMIFETFMDPHQLEEKNGSYLGAAFSIRPGNYHRPISRFPHRSGDIRNLYYVGAGTHPGPFVPGVLLGVNLAVKAIKEDFSSE